MTLKALTDKLRHVQYGLKIHNIRAGEPDFWSPVIMTDEAHCTLSGSVKTRNVCYWGTNIRRGAFKFPKMFLFGVVYVWIELLPAFLLEDDKSATAMVECNIDQWYSIF